ncbi:MAG: 3'-5' exonuclease [Bacteroidales bacterium]|nr:3'-5' exonuclease [Bacteroidales bacterium]
MDNFAAIDFETANQHPESVCSVGIAVVRDGQTADTFYSLIHPTPDYYSRFNTAVHGLCDADTAAAPTFPEVWQQVAPLIEGLPLVAHNKRFDENCLRAVFRTYRMDYPDYDFLCTLMASRRRLRKLVPNHRLDTVAAYCGFPMENHHHALADAEACAHIALRLL